MTLKIECPVCKTVHVNGMPIPSQFSSVEAMVAIHLDWLIEKVVELEGKVDPAEGSD